MKGDEYNTLDYYPLQVRKAMPKQAYQIPSPGKKLILSIRYRFKSETKYPLKQRAPYEKVIETEPYQRKQGTLIGTDD